MTEGNRGCYPFGSKYSNVERRATNQAYWGERRANAPVCGAAEGPGWPNHHTRPRLVGGPSEMMRARAAADAVFTFSETAIGLPLDAAYLWTF